MKDKIYSFYMVLTDNKENANTERNEFVIASHSIIIHQNVVARIFDIT